MCTPVADVVLWDYGVAEEFEDSANAVADDGAAQVAYVHLFGDVGAGEIYDDSLRLLNFAYAEMVFRVHAYFEQ